MNPQSICIEVLTYYRYNIQYMYIGIQKGIIKWAKITEGYKEQHIQKLI